ncbi:MAG TPA: Rne/Rng family ribonuclease, partial [Chroococcales cyanobacterium]
MKKEIVISEADNLAAVIEDGRAVEFFLRQGEQLVGDIILGQVESVVQGIEAAFVNIGQDRNGFIHMADLPSAQSPRKRLKNAFVRPKELLLVQIAKAPTGTKGARLTGRISIPGRFVVFVSHDNRVNISRRIINPQERDRLRQLTYNLKDPGHGLIIRTEAEGASEEDLKKDIEDLIATWSDILHQAQLNKPPMLLFRDQDLLTRVLREAASHDTTRIVVDSQSAVLRAKAVLQNWMPEMSRNVALHRGPQPIMKQFNLDREIKNALLPKVHLPSGGSLVIESTEALTVVDVNSGRLVGSRNLAETVLRTNLEAATELARQLRLRDIGGVVVVDFISMDHASDQQKVLNHLHEAMKPDKARPQIGAMFSEHGLLEISRRRQGQNLLEQLTSPCPHCKGVGRVRNEILTSTELLPSVTMEDLGEFSEVTEVAEIAEITQIPELVSEIDETEEMELAAEESAEAAPEVKKRRRRRRSRRPREAVAESAIAPEETEISEIPEISEVPEISEIPETPEISA